MLPRFYICHGGRGAAVRRRHRSKQQARKNSQERGTSRRQESSNRTRASKTPRPHQSIIGYHLSLPCAPHKIPTTAKTATGGEGSRVLDSEIFFFVPSLAVDVDGNHSVEVGARRSTVACESEWFWIQAG